MAPELFGLSISLLLLLAGTALIISEALAPGAHFFVIGAALFAAGLVGLLLPPGLGPLTLLVLAGVVVAVAGVTLWGYRHFDIAQGTGKGKTSDSDSLRGQTGRVTERVTETEGQVKLESGGFNPMYEARTVDGEVAVGEEVIVLDPGGGNVLTVEAMADLADEIDRELARGRSPDEAVETVAGEEAEAESASEEG